MPVTQFSIFLCLTLIPAAFSLTFTMTPIKTSDGGSLNLTGDAYISSEGLQVTTNERDKASTNRFGRATYGDLLHLWDKSSQKMADFSTRFSLVIDSSGSYNFGDGLAFFMAPNGSSIKPWSGGGGLGLGNATSVDSSPLETFVAVEFDTFPNPGIDPPYNGGRVVPHVGIDINNVSSVATATWYNNVSAGWENEALISYNSTTKVLRVDFVGFYANMTRPGNLSYEVDLRDYLPEYVTVGFSATTGASFQKNTVKSWSFSSTDVRTSNEDLPIPPSPEPDQKSDVNKVVMVIGLSVGIPVFILAAVCVLCLLLRKKKKKKKMKEKYEELEEEHLSDSAMDDEFEKGNGPKKFSYSELVAATNDFAAEQKLGEGGFGGVYKGFLKAENRYIAVKKVAKGSQQGRKEYAAEVKIISQLRHVNLVQLMGWCHQREELLLVYEFMPNGSLDSHLFKLKSELPWETRYRIAQGLASALLYLHEEWTQYVVHRDIKSSNVMLDGNFNAKLGDFGLARFVDHDKDMLSTVPAGTLGYMAPEYPVTGKASKETDIYSFGIVLLEIACGRRPIDHSHPANQVVLVEWVWSLYGCGQVLDAADAKVDSSESDARKIERLMVVGLWCIHPDSSLRPSIRQVLQLLNSQDPLPSLPLQMPRPIYYTPRLFTSNSSGNVTTSSAGSIAPSVDARVCRDLFCKTHPRGRNIADKVPTENPGFLDAVLRRLHPPTEEEVLTRIPGGMGRSHVWHQFGYAQPHMNLPHSPLGYGQWRL